MLIQTPGRYITSSHAPSSPGPGHAPLPVIHTAIYLPVYLPACLPVCLPVSLPAYLPAYVPIILSPVVCVIMHIAIFISPYDFSQWSIFSFSSLSHLTAFTTPTKHLSTLYPAHTIPRAHCITALMKLVAQNGSCPQAVFQLVCLYEHSASLDLHQR